MRSPLWRLKCKRYWYSVGGMQCQACGSRKNLHVHHMTYDRFTRELLTDLMGLCKMCHEKVHKDHRTHGGNLMFITKKFVMNERKKRGLE